MNTQTFIDENQKKLKFPFCAVMLIVSQLLSFLESISAFNNLTVNYWIELIMFLTIAVVMLAKKQGALLLVPLGILLVNNFISHIRLIGAFGGLSLESFFGSFDWKTLILIAIILLILSNYFDISAIKKKEKIILIFLLLAFIISVCVFLRNSIVLYEEFNFPIQIYSGLGDFLLSCVVGVIEYTALLLIGFYIANPYKKSA